MSPSFDSNVDLTFAPTASISLNSPATFGLGSLKAIEKPCHKHDRDEYVSAVPPSFEWQPLTAYLIQFDHQQPALTFVRISQYHRFL